MGGRRRASAHRGAASTASTPNPPPRPAAYHSDSDSDDDADPLPQGPIPLASLEQHTVRDFTTSSTPPRKRVRADSDDLQHSSDPTLDRKHLAEKVVWRKFDGDNRVFADYYQRLLPETTTTSTSSNDNDNNNATSNSAHWHALVSSLHQPVPVSIRINGNFQSLSEIVAGTLETDFSSLQTNTTSNTTSNANANANTNTNSHKSKSNNNRFKSNAKSHANATSTDTDTLPTPFQLSSASWDLDHRVFQLSVDAKQLRKHSALQPLAQYLRKQQQLGTIQRLDLLTSALVCMLQVSGGLNVLDLGGGGDLRSPAVAEALGSNRGMLVVNTPDASAAAQAVQHLSRTLPVATQVVVTMHRPLQFPNVDAFRFDRVLCAAPSSSDGLIRGHAEKWRTWTPALALQQHSTQVSLLTKAIELLRVGGVLVYATHSMNPIENEAVVAAVVESSHGALEVGNVETVCPGLERLPGWKTWPVVDAEMHEVATWESTTSTQRRQLRASMWPPTEDDIHLERCVRFLPHLNDSNGMFVAQIRKVRDMEEAPVLGPTAPAPKPTPMRAKAKAKASETKQERLANKKRLGSLFPMAADDLEHLQSFFGVDPSVWKSTHVMERSGFAQDRAVHLVSSNVFVLLTHAIATRLCVFRAGVDAFKHVHAAAPQFELTDHGARALVSSLDRRVLSLPRTMFENLMTSKEMWVKNVIEADVRNQLGEMQDGSMVVVLDDMEPLQTADRDIVLIAVKRPSSCSIVSTSATIARIKTLIRDLEHANNEDEDDGYDSMEYDDM